MNFKKKALKSMPYAQAHVRIYDNGDIDLVSYTTVVMAVRNGLLFPSTDLRWPFSKTTTRHIGRFMKEYGFGDYYTAKNLYNKGCSLDIYTGEIVEK